MEIADVVSCNFYNSTGWERCEKSKFSIYQQDNEVGISVETTWTETEDSPEAAAQLDISRIDVHTVKQIQSLVGDWLYNGSAEKTEYQTMPVEGKYKDSTTEEDVWCLKLDINAERLRIMALSNDMTSMANAVTIPATARIENDDPSDQTHLERLYSILEIFFAAMDPDTDDIIQSTRYLLNPDLHIHPDLSESCTERLHNQDYPGVIQGAAVVLEDALRSSHPPEAPLGSKLATEVFKPGDPVFKWGYESAEQKGIMYLYTGAFLALRNPISHRHPDRNRNRFLDDIDKRDAIDILCFFNFLRRKLDMYGTDELEREAVDN